MSSSEAITESISGLTLDDYKQDLRTRFADRSFTITHALSYLASAGCITSRRTLQRRMKDWDITRNTKNYHVLDDEVHNHLVEQIGYLFHHSRYLNDDQIAIQLQENYSLATTPQQVKSLRLKQGWRRLERSSEQATTRRAETTNFIAQLLREGNIRQYGRRQLLTHLSRKYGYRASSRDISYALRAIPSSSAAVDSRLPGMKRKRRLNYETKGPNWLWCVDGHDKLSSYGIEIYGCVDAYSRKIIWWYVGLSNRTGISVCRQYLNTIKVVGRCPNFIRSDCGSETTLMASCHYDLYWQSCLDHGVPDEELNNLTLYDCYRYGKSTRNIRIEAMWNQMIMSITESWICYFSWLKSQGLYRGDEKGFPTDKVILLYILLPIVQKEIFEWVADHNANPIRPQRERTKHVPGIPNELYQGRDRAGKVIADQHGFLFDERTWEQCSEEIGGCEYNPADVLTNTTIDWCYTNAVALGVTEPRANEFITQGGMAVPYWYQCLVHTARQHHASGATPKLELAPKPYLGEIEIQAEVAAAQLEEESDEEEEA